MSIISRMYCTSSGSCTPPTIWKCFVDHMNDAAHSNSARRSVEASVGKTVDHMTWIGSSASARSVDRQRSCRVDETTGEGGLVLVQDTRALENFQRRLVHEADVVGAEHSDRGAREH